MPVRIMLRPHKDAVTALENEGFTVTPVRFSRGDHIILQVSKGERSGRITVSGSPSRRFLLHVLTAAKRATSEEREYR
jgi:predicted RNA binding protein YcfA (HicA-like mRNA interferase family)